MKGPNGSTYRNGRGQAMEDMMDNQNQRMTENLSAKVSHLKSLAFDMEVEAKDQNKYLNEMDTDFDSSKGLLSGSVNRLSQMVSAGKGNRKLLCYIILGLVFAFMFLYYIVGWFAR